MVKLYFLVKAIKILNVINIKPAIPFRIYIVVIRATHKKWPIIFLLR